MGKLIKSFLDWIGRYQIVSEALQYIWALIPAGWFIGTGVVGYMTGQPLMWIFVAVAAVAAFICVAMLAGMIIQIYKDPENKLKFVSANVGVDFAKQKSANTAKRIEKVQVMMQIRNDAHFPMSIILENAESSIQDHTPPRGKFPKDATTQGAGAVFFMTDDLISLPIQAQNLIGTADFRIRYGHPGYEKYILRIKGNVSVSMNADGSIRGIWFGHSS